MGNDNFWGWITTHKGGPGSGNFGHAGRPGKVGGSAPDRSGGRSGVARGEAGGISGDMTPPDASDGLMESETNPGNVFLESFFVDGTAFYDRGVRSKTKDSICKKVVEEDPTLTYGLVDAVLASWAHTSSKSVRACDLQKAASLEFGVPLSEYHERQREKALDYETENDPEIQLLISQERRGDLTYFADEMLKGRDELIKYGMDAELIGDVVDFNSSFLRLSSSASQRYHISSLTSDKIFSILKNPQSGVVYFTMELKLLEDERDRAVLSGDVESDKYNYILKQIDVYKQAISIAKSKRCLELSKRYNKMLDSLSDASDGVYRKGKIEYTIGTMLRSVHYRAYDFAAGGAPDKHSIVIGSLEGIARYMEDAKKGDAEKYIRKRMAEKRELIDKQSAGLIPEYRKILRAMYNITQREFEKQGITFVYLARGFDRQGHVDPKGLPRSGVVDIATYIGNTIESWTTSGSTAAGFGDYTALAKISVKRILCSAVTGLGCLNEYEFIVFGSLGGKVKLYTGGTSPWG